MKRLPSSVYRLQLTGHFTIKRATALLPYLKSLGVEGVYCSPYFEAFSPHGYDITNPNRINPALASQREYERFCEELHRLGLFHLADVVPNHMGIRGNNTWWQDVLQRGPHSLYASFFDIDWSKEKLLVPLLGEDRVVEETYYKLVPWWTAATQTSYRRFFAINELIGIRIEDPAVLRAHHKLLFQLLKERKIDGIRIDHPDGLLDPATYFARLREKHKGLIFVEKILAWNETLPSNWRVDGTVGYEFAHHLTGLFVQKSVALTKVYHRFIGEEQDFDAILYESKKSFLQEEMRGDIDNLVQTLPAADGEKCGLVQALIELLACFAVYRTYIPPKGPAAGRDLSYIDEALKRAQTRAPHLKKRFTFLKEVFHLKRDYRKFILKFQQLCAPAMAKGFEDTALYRYNRLLALNDVGFDPKRHAVTKEEFHTFCQEKQKHYPYGLLSTSTHDSKRSMDVRMQLATLSQIPEEWEQALATFAKFNQPYKTHGYPDANAEYFLYQTILGVWPSKPTTSRIWQSFQKSIREARKHTSWREPNSVYEGACERFLRAILKKKSPFVRALDAFHRSIAQYGRWNSLAATALKLGAPGIVDIYEGCENFRYTLVDPDNRTPIHFNRPWDVKGELHSKALHLRQKYKALFLDGAYIPLEVVGEGEEHVVAFLRSHKHRALLVAACRFFPDMPKLDKTWINLPKSFKKRGIELFTGRALQGHELSAREIFAEAPFAWVSFSSGHQNYKSLIDSWLD